LLGVVGWLGLRHPSLEAEVFWIRRGEIMDVIKEEPRHEVGGFQSQGVRLRSDTGLTVDLRVLRPAESAEPLPLVVVLGGHRTGRDAVALLGAPGPLVVAALDYPYDGPERPRGWRESLRAIGSARQALPDTPPAALLAVEWLLAQPWVDPARAELMGVSLGVPFAAVVGALEPRLGRVWLVHGGGDNRVWLKHSLTAEERPRWVSHWLARGLYRVARAGWFEANEWVGDIAPREVVVIGAREDQRLPAGEAERLYAAAGVPRELLWTEGGHVDRRPEKVERILALARERIMGPTAGKE
jgi:dienelactone hydrolase